ncbi:MAG: septation regulator SpoVG [Oscillospiraceae bacterium]
MTITDIKVRKIFTAGKLKGIVSITIDNVFAVHDIKVVQGDERLFVAMPSRKDDNGMYRDIVHPINPEARREIESHILDAYKIEVERQEAEAEAEADGDSYEN